MLTNEPRLGKAIPEAVRDRMACLEEIDREDRDCGTPRMNRLQQVPQQTGRFIALLAAAPEGKYIAIGPVVNGQLNCRKSEHRGRVPVCRTCLGSYPTGGCT
jgi:hypothetical protein